MKSLKKQCDELMRRLYGNILWWYNKRCFINRFNKNGIHEIYRLKWILLDVEPETRLAEEINILIKSMEDSTNEIT